MSIFWRTRGKVSFGERLDTVVFGLDAATHPLQPEVLADAIGDYRSRQIASVKWDREVFEEL